MKQPAGNDAGKAVRPPAPSRSHGDAERRRVEAALRDSEDRFRLIAEAASDWFWETDSALRFTYISERFFEITGQSAGMFIGKTREQVATRLILDRDPEQWRRHLDDMENRRPFRDFEYALTRPDGLRVTIRLSGKPRFDANGVFLGYIGAGTDVTRQQAAEESQRQILLELDAIFTHASVGIVYSRERVIQRCNPRAAEILGYTREELVGRPGVSIYPSIESYEELGRAAGPLLAAGASFNAERQFRRKDGSLVWCRTFAKAYDPEDTRRGTIWIMEDIEETRSVQAALAATMSELEAIMSNASVGILFTRDGMMQRYNPKFAEMFGAGDTSLIGLPASLLFHSAGAHEALGRSAFPLLSAGRPFNSEMIAQRRDGSTFHAEVIGYLIDPAHPQLGTIWILNDISARRAEEARQRQTLLELEAIFTNASVGIIYSHGLVLQRCNPRAAEILGYAPEELIGQSMVVIAASKEASLAQGQAVGPLLAAGKSHSGEAQYRRKDGSLVWCHFLAKAIDPGNLDRGVIWIGEDIEERRQAQEQLKAALRELGAIMDNASVGILLTRDRKIRRHNRKFGEMFGFSESHAIGQPGHVLYRSGEEYDELGRLAGPLLSAAKPFQTELYMRRQDGTDLWINLIGYVSNPDQPAEGTIWLLEDRTAYKRADEALRRSHDELEERVSERTAELSQQLHFQQQLIEAIPSPVFYKDAKVRYLGCNSAFEAFIGRPASELIGMTPHDIAPPELADKYVAADRELLDKPGSQIYESQARCANGEMRDVMFHKAAFTRPDGTAAGLVGVMLDITERKRLEDNLRQAATVFESSAEGVTITKPDGAIIAVNRAFTEITGYEESEVLGLNPRLLQSGRHDKTFYREMWASLFSTGRWRGEIWNRRKCGELYPEWLSIAAVHDKQGRLTNYVATFSDITQHKRTEEQIRLLAFSDPLTGLPNRRLLLDRLQHALAASARNKRHGALFFIDLDDFKDLNDTLGHDKGDLLLQQVARRLAGCIRESDTVARLGGDEFVVMLEDLDEKLLEAIGRADSVGEKILSALNQPYMLGETKHHSTPSIGVTLFGDQHTSVEELLKQADLAMYQAKKSGRNALRFFDPEMQTVVAARVAMEADLRQGIEKNQFVLHYQPQVDRIGRTTGVEALIRWNHPQRGIVLPAEFIPLAEDTGLILPLGLWALDKACAQLNAWARRPETAHLTMAVNVSAQQFRQRDFYGQVLAALDGNNADPRKLKLELTESLLLDNVEEIITKMTALKEQKVGFSLDDFGTGYSSLSYLKRLPLDQIKIDQSFVRDVLFDPNDAAIARTIVALAHTLGLPVIAEGVETEEQLLFLASIGCHAYQGYLFSRPLLPEAFEEFARQA